MNPQKETRNPEGERQRKSLSSWFFTREEPDKNYLPDLKTQWGIMTRAERVKFVFGALIGLLLFISALVLVYFLLTNIVTWLGFF